MKKLFEVIQQPSLNLWKLASFWLTFSFLLIILSKTNNAQENHKKFTWQGYGFISWTKKIVLIACLVLSCCLGIGFSQNEEIPCGFQITKEDLAKLQNPNSIANKRLKFIKKYPLQRVFGIPRLEYKNDRFSISPRAILKDAQNQDLTVRSIPIIAHIVRNSNGNGGLTVGELNSALIQVNQHFRVANFNFFICQFKFINSDAIFNNNFHANNENSGNQNSSAEVLSVESRNLEGFINIYFVPNSNTSWAWGPNSDPLHQHLLIHNSQATSSSTLSHELGHWFDLLHTHDAESGVELVNGSNCDSAGDLVCDTPADPNLSGQVDQNCNYTGNALDPNRARYRPDTRNLLSYSRPICRNIFSQGQVQRMQSSFLGMESDRGYEFTCCENGLRENGAVTAWILNGPSVKPGGYGPAMELSAGWEAVASGDFNGDNIADFLLRKEGQVAVWLINDVFKNQNTYGPAMALQSGWSAVAAGDFDGDGKDDILLNKAGQVAVWLMDGVKVKPNGYGTALNLQIGWSAVAAGDFDGDGKDDILLRKAGQVAVWLMYGVTVKLGGHGAAMNLQSGWSAVAAGDFDGDGKDDILLGKNKGVAVWLMDGVSVKRGGHGSAQTLQAGWLPVAAGDFDGDRKEDILLSKNEQVATWLMNGTTVKVNGYGTAMNIQSGWKAVSAGDYDHDGKADILLNAIELHKVDSDNDGCDQSNWVRINGRYGEVAVNANSCRLIELPGLTNEIGFYCGRSLERVRSNQLFNWVLCQRAKNGAISWTFYRSAP